MLFSNLEKFKSNIAFIDNNEKNITYDKLLSDIKVFQNILSARSIILIITSNSYECLSLYIASIRLNHIPLLVDEKTNEDYILNLIKIYKPNFLFFRKKIIKYPSNYKFIKNIGNFVLYENNKFFNNKIYKDLALLVGTSGSTGSPKMVRLSNKNLYYNTKSIISYLKINHKHITITTLPFSYSYGLSIINSHIHSGASIILNEFSMTQSGFWNLFSKYLVTSLASVPFNYEIIKKLKIKSFNNSSFKYATVAGGRLDNKTLIYFYHLFKEYKKKFIVMYGQTEASPRMSYLKWEDLYQNIGSIGNAIPGGEFNLRNTKEYAEVNNLQIGELVFKGKNVCLGYSENLNDLSKGNENKQILFTGDLAYRKNKNFYIYGRISRIIKCAGKRINLDHLETQLKNLEIECACLGSDNKLKIFILDKKKIEQTKKILVYKMVLAISFIKIQVINEIPKFKSGKINYKVLNKL